MTLSPRTLKNIATLDARAQAAFTQFAQLAAGEAAKHGCEYHMIAGNRSWAEQDALYARFRIAISFPDLSMMGANSFMNIMKSPEAIREALALTAGGKKDAR